MVVVPKKSGAVRICVDLKPLNVNVLREPHPTPKVDDTLALLAGATQFSKLDAGRSLCQKSLVILTTFVTPYGRYHFHLEYRVPQNCFSIDPRGARRYGLFD